MSCKRIVRQALTKVKGNGKRSSRRLSNAANGRKGVNESQHGSTSPSIADQSPSLAVKKGPTSNVADSSSAPTTFVDFFKAAAASQAFPSPSVVSMSTSVAPSTSFPYTSTSLPASVAHKQQALRRSSSNSSRPTGAARHIQDTALTNHNRNDTPGCHRENEHRSHECDFTIKI